MEYYLTLGILLGLSAGFAPGPLLVLVISETLQHGALAGVKVALAPLITDLPIIISSIFLLQRMAGFEQIIGVFSITGGCFVFYLGVESICIQKVSLDGNTAAPKSLQKGLLTNILSPHPYLFWFGVGAPAVVQAMDISHSLPLFFIIPFYLLLCGSKVLLALLVDKSRSFLRGSVYIYSMRFLGACLLALSLLLIRDGLGLLF